MQGKHYSFEIRRWRGNREIYSIQKFPLVEDVPVLKEKDTWIMSKEDLAALKNTIKAILNGKLEL